MKRSDKKELKKWLGILSLIIMSLTFVLTITLVCCGEMIMYTVIGRVVVLIALAAMTLLFILLILLNFLIEDVE